MTLPHQSSLVDRVNDGHAQSDSNCTSSDANEAGAEATSVRGANKRADADRLERGPHPPAGDKTGSTAG